MHIAQLTALEAHEVVMAVLDVGVVTRGSATGVHLLDLAHRHQLVECVVYRRQADLWETLPGPLEHLFCGQVDVVTPHDLGYYPSLRRQAPAQRSEALEKRRRGHAPMYTSKHL